MNRKTRFSRWLVGMVILALAECACIAALQIAFTDPAQAQSRRRSGGFFQQLFGLPEQRYEDREREQAPVDYSRAPSSRKADSKTESVEPTTSIVVLGDGMADWLAYGLEDAFSDAPEVAIVRESKARSGLLRYEARSDLDWWDVTRDILGKGKANYVVMMLGVSDRQNIREKDIELTDEKKEADANKEDKPDSADSAIIAPEPKTTKRTNGVVEFRSEPWEKVYSRRIDATVAALKSKGVPVFWVGLPSIRGTRSTADVVYLNDLYRARAERAGAVYIDVWDGFVDEAGKYSSYGPDYEGQRRRLRSGDGVYFTQYGARKLAHYVEREIRRYMSNRGPIALPFGTMGPVLDDGKPKERPLAGPVVPLTMTRGNTETLLGGGPASSSMRLDAIATGVLVKGDPLAPPPGRADDFVWSRGSEAPRVAPAATSASASVPAVAPAKPAAPAVAKPDPVTKPVVSKPLEPKPLEPKPLEPKSSDSKNSASNPAAAKPEVKLSPPAAKPPAAPAQNSASPKPARPQETRPARQAEQRPPREAPPRPPQPLRRSSDGLFGTNGPFGWIGSR